MLLANSKTITDDVTLTLPYVSFDFFFSMYQNLLTPRLYNAAASSLSRPREGDEAGNYSCYVISPFVMLFIAYFHFISHCTTEDGCFLIRNMYFLH